MERLFQLYGLFVRQEGHMKKEELAESQGLGNKFFAAVGKEALENFNKERGTSVFKGKR